jgi:acetyl-CoA synthetase
VALARRTVRAGVNGCIARRAFPVCFHAPFSTDSDSTVVHSLMIEDRIFPPPKECTANAITSSFAEYKKQYKTSIENPEQYWKEVASAFDWVEEPKNVIDCDFTTASIKWFEGGKLNATTNLLDRHINSGKGKRSCLTFEADDGASETFSYEEVLRHVEAVGNVLRKELGVKKGDRVTIYLPMIPLLAFSVLACARIGAVHSVVFAGFSAEALATRIEDCESNVVLTCGGGIRGGKTIPLKAVVNEAAKAKGCNVTKVAVTQRSPEANNREGWEEGRDLNFDALVEKYLENGDACVPETMRADDPLFILYTSGSTGKPKGVMHSTAGYLTYAAHTFRNVFDYQGAEDDVHFCTADIGWITGHSYLLYGPLANGAHSVMFEGVPTYPDVGRFWEICEKHRVTTFYTAPTAIRSLMVHGSDPVEKHDLSHLRLLGTVGEPINPEAWMWYHEVVGKSKLPIVDTWWQTETGGILLSPLPGATPTKPGSCCLPQFGVDPVIVDSSGKEVDIDVGGHLCFKSPWPGLMQGVYNNSERFYDTYFKEHKGLYFSGDMARKDKDGYIWIMGRTDDVMNVSGHRVGSAEIESSLVKHDAVCEAAVVGTPHEIKGEAIYCYVTLETEALGNDRSELAKELRGGIRSTIGPIASPEEIHFTQELPKTRSGKIMRRILRKIAARETEDMGDISTLADPAVVEGLIASRESTK